MKSAFQPLQSLTEEHHNTFKYIDHSRNALHRESTKNETLLDFRKRKRWRTQEPDREKSNETNMFNLRNGKYIEVTGRSTNPMVGRVDTL